MAAETGALQRFHQAGLSAWLLALFCGWGLLLWLGSVLGMGGRLPAPHALSGNDLPQARAAAPDRIGPLTQYSAAAARPLFTEDRRPRSFLATAQAGEGEDVASSSLDFLLTGVLISPQVRMAILQPAGGGESQRVRVGSAPEGAAGWRLVEVQPRKAVFEGSNGQATLDLRAFGDAAVVPPAAATAVPSQGPPERFRASPPPPPPGVDGSATPADQQARIDAIRRRIEARRAQMRANQQNADNASQPPGGAPRGQ